MLQLPSLMTKNNFWTSGLQLLTTDWQNRFPPFNKSYQPHADDILLSREQAQIPGICVKRRQRKRGQRAVCLLRIRRQSNKPPLPSILLANVRSLEKEIDDLRGRLNYQWDIQNCNILCFTESWLNDDTINIQLAGYTLYWQDRTTASGKTRGGGLCTFVNNSWCTISKEVS
ncbi:unnamed protein product [Oncorhynchus mykiss]|uniref:Uncharacterized protein n=1 Tax=Oncorhynchus mykiss TaxID=8022 RepID=A0A060VUI7_ONCMY|nr:unnamed protein product [Oncorhynchus mykiss]